MKNKKFINTGRNAVFLAVLLISGICATGCEGGSSSDSSRSSTAYYQSGGTESLTGQSYSSSKSDENAVEVVNGGIFILDGSTITKTGDTSDKEGSGFYGFNSGVLASSSGSDSSYKDCGSATTITMTDCDITTDASGANGAFAFGERAVIELNNVTIVTTGSDNSRGVDATYGGTVTIANSEISTTGGSCAALATDRYESYSAPKINATNVTGTTSGSGSPGIYCTGTFTVTGCTLTATGSEAAVIEGLNSITLSNTSISGAKKWGVMIYQSMSGDSSSGTGTFTMTGGTLTNASTGPLFFVCNTSAVITLNGSVTINNNYSDTLLWATNAATGSAGNSNVNSTWGSLGGTVIFKAVNQALTGNIVMAAATSATGSGSSIALTLSTSSSLSGAINASNNASSATLTLDSSSSWTATGISYLTSLTDGDGAYGNIDSAYNIYVNGATSGSYTTSVTLTSGGKLYIK